MQKNSDKRWPDVEEWLQWLADQPKEMPEDWDPDCIKPVVNFIAMLARMKLKEHGLRDGGLCCRCLP